MAGLTDVIRNSSTFFTTLNNSLNSTRKSFSSLNNSVSGINKRVAGNIKIKRELFLKNQSINRLRQQASLRRELEDSLEASKVSTSATGALTLAGSSSGPPFSRLLNVLGFITAGWMVENIPTWTFMGKEFVTRINKVGSSLFKMSGDIREISTDFTGLLKNTFVALSTFNFRDFTEGSVSKSFESLNKNLQEFGDKLSNAFSIFSVPLTQSLDGTQRAPGLGEEPSQTFFPEGPAPSSTTRRLQLSQTQKQALDIISDRESKSSGNYNAMNNGEAGDRPGGAKKWLGKNLTDMTIGEVKRRQNDDKTIWAAGRYQFIPSTFQSVTKMAGLKDTDMFDEDTQDLMGITLLKNGGIGHWTAGGSRFSRDELEIIERARKEEIRYSSGPAAPAPTRPTSTGTLSLIPQTGAGGFIQGGSGSGSDTYHATHYHIDYKDANPGPAELARIREVAFFAVKAMLDRGSWVYLGNAGIYIYKGISDSKLKSSILAEQEAHDRRSSPGIDIQEHNPSVGRTFPSQPGSKTKFPFAVGEVYYRGGYGREAEILGSNGITVSHGAPGSKASSVTNATPVSSSPSTARPAPPPAAVISPPPTPPIPAQITPPAERPAADTIIFAPQPQNNVPVALAQSSPIPPPSTINDFRLLNNFIKNKLLLDLAYL